MSNPSILPKPSELIDPSSQPGPAERMRGAIWGQLVGDAFCLGSHWIYNLAELETTFPGGSQGFESPREGHYHFGKAPGELTHYGDAALVMLESVASLGHFDPADFLRRFEASFGPSYPGYRDKATRGTLENLQLSREAAGPGAAPDAQNGADDDQPATASRLASVVVAHWNHPDFFQATEQATRVCQNNERAVVYMKANALILQDLLSGRDVHSALHRTEERIVQLDPTHGVEVSRKITAAMEASLRPVRTAIVDEFGQSCPLASSFPSAVHSLVVHSKSYEQAMLENARAGGDNAGRAGMLGAWLGAHLGLRAVPEPWRNRLAARDKIISLTAQLLTKAAA